MYRFDLFQEFSIGFFLHCIVIRIKALFLHDIPFNALTIRYSKEIHDLPSFVLLVLLFVVLVLPELAHDDEAHVPHNVSPPGKGALVPI